MGTSLHHQSQISQKLSADLEQVADTPGNSLIKSISGSSHTAESQGPGFSDSRKRVIFLNEKCVIFSNHSGLVIREGTTRFRNLLEREEYNLLNGF